MRRVATASFTIAAITASMSSVIVYQVTDGKFAVFNLYFDQLALLEQLGALPTA